MATGESKTKWDGEPKNSNSALLNDNDNTQIVLSYPNKAPVEDILWHEPASLQVLYTSGDATASPFEGNNLYYGDNLSVLATLLQAPQLYGKIQLVYIDPPFATNSVFKSRSQTNAYTDLLTGANYLEFIRKRLILLRELLSDTGSIYVHLDGNMVFHVKVIMDEIFGVKNFRSSITRRKCNPKNYTRNTYGNISDYILFYTKSEHYVWNRAYEAWTEDKIAKEYPYVEENTGRRYKKVPLHAPGERRGATGSQWRGMMPPKGKHWQYVPATLDELDSRGEIYWSPNGNPRRKVYLDRSDGLAVQDIWMDVKDAHNQNIKITGYPTEKPVELLKRIINASSNVDDLVLDCFSGSGTTLAVAQSLERRWLGIDNSPEALKATLQRFTKGTEKMGDYVLKPHTQPALPLFLDSSLNAPNFSLLAQEPYDGELDETISRLPQKI